MKLFPLKLSLCCAALCLASPLAADTAAPAGHKQAQAGRTLTGKERLGPKWTDEQRIDNCNVPLDKRGTRARPSLCAEQQTH
jgi:hypothetical protein